jgi:hypothetical protein
MREQEVGEVISLCPLNDMIWAAWSLLLVQNDRCYART